MTEPMTPEKLAEIKEREAKTTPGPWEFGKAYVYRFHVPNEPRNGNGFRVGSCVDEQDLIDTVFVAFARQDIPLLLAEVERLQAELKRVQGNNRPSYSLPEGRPF